jgi:hypothetical protein
LRSRFEPQAAIALRRRALVYDARDDAIYEPVTIPASA